MNVKATTDTENKPKATVKNFQFVENLDKLIDIAEKAEENDEVQEGNRRSSYDLVMIRSRYIDRYDWYDTIVIAPCIMDEITYPTGRCVVIRCGKKYGLVYRGVNNLYIAPQYDSIEFVDMEQPCTVMRDGVEGVINETGTFMTLEESLYYEGYLVGEYKPELFFKD